MDKKHLDELHELQSVEDAMKWHGWGSPVGVSVFLLTIVIIAAIIKIVFFG